MKSKRLSLGNRYKRFFLGERTALIAALVSILILPVNEKLNPPAMLGRLEEDVSGMRK